MVAQTKIKLTTELMVWFWVIECKYLTDGTWIAAVFVPLKFKSQTLSEINDLTGDIWDDHEPHVLKRLVEINLWGGLDFNKVLILGFLDRLIAWKHFVEFFNSEIFLNFIVPVSNEHDNANEHTYRVHNQIREFWIS